MYSIIIFTKKYIHIVTSGLINNCVEEAHEFFWLTAIRSLTLFVSALFLLLLPSLNKENTHISDTSSAPYACSSCQCKTYSYRSLFFQRVCPASLLIQNEWAVPHTWYCFILSSFFNIGHFGPSSSYLNSKSLFRQTCGNIINSRFMVIHSKFKARQTAVE